MGIPYEMVSGSEPEGAFRAFAEANHDFHHLYRDLSDQLHCRQCTLHPARKSCQPDDGECDILVMGTPCNPFSQQRSKRFQGTVLNHSLAHHTFEDAYSMLEKVKPIHAILEQTHGFGMVIQTGATQSPMRMLLNCLRL